MKLLKKGSVKDIYVKDDETLCFSFSDRYSIYDWGEMPDLIEEKGRALAQIAAKLFDLFNNKEDWKDIDIPEHLKKLFSHFVEKGISHHFLDVEKNKIFVKRIHVPQISDGNYIFYQEKPCQTLVPLEVIFRLKLNKNSSIFSRLENKDYIKSLGLRSLDQRNFEDDPIVEFSTKIEVRDRYLSYHEAKKIAFLSETEFKKLKETTQILALILNDFFKKKDISLIDGKLEFAFGDILENGERELILVDSIGPDELRLEYGGLLLSKQLARDFYAKTKWKACLDQAKKISEKENKHDWVQIYSELNHGQSPPKLLAAQKKQLSNMYIFLEKLICHNKLDKELLKA